MNNYESYIKRCFELALKGAGNVSPNPLVGSVIVKDGKIIGEGYHEKYGEAHAEKNAIKNSIESTKDATLIVNLEPCCHTNKKTPPCVPSILEAGINKVVICNVDPNPNVAGKGIKQLEENGIEVITNILKEEGEELNKIFFKTIKSEFPFITIKIAQSLDGKISAGKGIQTWLTGEESKKFVHQQRVFYDALLVGANTINIDNPELTVREVKGRNPKRIIIDGNLSAKIESKVYKNNSELTTIFTKKNSNNEKIDKLKNCGVNVIELESIGKNNLEITEILKIIRKQGINSILVEGGKNIFSNFISKGLFDELIILQAPILLGKGVDSFDVENELKLKFYSKEMLGNDLKLVYKNENWDI